MQRHIALLAVNTQHLGDIFISKVFHRFPDGDINYWRSGAFSVETGEDQCFEMEPAIKDDFFADFFDAQIKESILSEEENFYYYIVEFCDIDFFKEVLSIIPSNLGIELHYSIVEDVENIYKVIRRSVNR